MKYGEIIKNKNPPATTDTKIRLINKRLLSIYNCGKKFSSKKNNDKKVYLWVT